MKDELYEASVLLVDDEDGILEIEKDSLSSQLRNVFTANTPLKAIELFKKYKIDLVVLDLKMPEMNGVQLLEELRKINRNVGCIFLTAYGDKDSVQAALRHGAYDFLDKPFDPQMLQVYVNRALQRVYYDQLLREVLELFVLNYTELDLSRFEGMGFDEKERVLKAALGVARMKIFSKKLAAEKKATPGA